MMRRPARRAGRPWQGARAVYIQGMTQAQYYGGNFLLALPGIGAGSVTELEAALHARGLALREDEEADRDDA